MSFLLRNTLRRQVSLMSRCRVSAYSPYSRMVYNMSTDAPEEKPSGGFFSRVMSFLRSEAGNINEVAQTAKNSRVAKRRLLDPSVVPYFPPELAEKKEDGPRVPEFDEEGREIEREEDEDRYEGPTDVVVAEDGRTVWRKRADAAAEKLSDNDLLRNVRRMTHKMESSENPLVQRLVDLKYDTQDTLDDLREGYETSQNRLVSGLRRVEDLVTSESEQAYALGELLRQDPNFNVMHLLEDMEQYMIPVIVNAVHKADMRVIQSAMSDMALDGVSALIKQRINKKEFHDGTIVGITHNEVGEYNIVNHVPVVSMVFICQQVHCVRDAEDKITEGGVSNVIPIYYVMTMRRDFYNPDFDWKIIDFKYQPMLSLA